MPNPVRWMAGSALVAGAALGLANCPWFDQRPTPVAAADGQAISLMDVAPVTLQVPPNARPGGAEPPVRIPLDGPWTDEGTTNKGMYKYSMRVPIRPRGLFFHRAQPGIEVQRGAAVMPYRRYVASEQPYWWHNTDELFVLYPTKRPPPEAGTLTLTYDRAVERERRLNFAMSGIDAPWDFVRAEVNAGWDNRNGLLLPAPGTATWDLTLPPAAELYMAPGLVEPELREAAPSDGCTAVLEVTAGGETVEAWRAALTLGKFPATRVDLSRWAGRAVTLTLKTEPGASSDYDYAFFGEPAVASRKDDPRRVVLAFIDTLRPDHLGIYGYERPTSPKLDALADRAAVFEAAHSVAPWTLPSARSVLTGRHPEYYDATPTLQRQLRQDGWATAMFAGNVYLSANFGMTRDWGIHRVGLWPVAEEVTDDAIAWLDHHDGRDAVVLVHYMDPHLPYKEPGGYRHLFAGDTCCGLPEEFHLSDVRKAQIKTEEDRQYVRDRYDNNIRYTTDQLDRLVQALGPNDVLVVFADHGEEFWDHRGFEHGHTLFEELLHVPLIIMGPGVDASRVSQPVSLLDITPTVLEMVGLDPSSARDGRSLLPAMQGDADAIAALGQRDLAFGRPLYGSNRWGVLTPEGMKWTTTEGRESLYDLTTDPDEQDNRLRKDQGKAGGEYRGRMAAALGRDVPIAYRLENSMYRGPGAPQTDLVVTLTLPGGVKTAWVGDEPLDRAKAEITMIDDETVEVRWPKEYRFQREVYIVPVRDPAEVTHELTMVVEDEGVTKNAYVPESVVPVPGKYRLPLFKVGLPHRTLRFTWAMSPVETDAEQELSGRDDETNAMLEAMGYVAHDEEQGEDDGGPASEDEDEDENEDEDEEPPAQPPADR